jgi:hypothetical protein
MAAGSPVLAEDLDAQNDQTELLSSLECVLISDHAGVTSSTTFVNTNLSRPVVASARYRVSALCYYTGVSDSSGVGDFKPGLSLPSGATVVRYTLIGLAGSATTAIGSTYWGSDTTFGALSAGPVGASSPCATYFEATITTGANAGNVVFQYAQAANSATATTLRAGSSMRVARVDGV